MLLRSSTSRPQWIFLAAQCSTRRLSSTASLNAHQLSAIHCSSQREPISLRLMPLGGSVTYGVGSSDGNGYRKFLYDLLVANGYCVSMVGSRKSGCMDDNNHEGWRGYRLDQIELKARRSLTILSPNLFMINAGSNDCLQNHELDMFGQRMDRMAEYLWLTSPPSTVVLSTLLVNADEEVNERVLRVNSKLRHLAVLKASQGKKIVLAEMNNNEGPQLSDLVDGTHPNDVGYQGMANIWFDAIQKARASGFLENKR
ncbi:hypothetical protein F53441_4973 [Fusarium austroafricanum]|uniref:SGNH hydrolase-type esterase domain-containing protein n=1 Tax=Fusarium austroafricanum TaxID=2364996 RepID=A0A8H4KKV9_9HYPO|nr:hypothetical protein F53441_4973 [Fusarium austroafricanum]